MKTSCPLILAALMFALGLRANLAAAGFNLAQAPYFLNQGLVSRSISFENPTGAPGQGGKAASALGPGRKGAPAKNLEVGEVVQLADIQGPGTIRHIWVTTPADPVILRGLVLRAWWDDQPHPSMECPLGDFMGLAHGKVSAHQSAVHSLGPNAGMNIWLPMPFTRRARLTLSNESGKKLPLFYQIDYTLKDKHPKDVGRLHVLFRRENPTTLKQDFELLPRRVGKGRFIGSVIGIRTLGEHWWGEGEVKVYLDGDREWPTICGTGSEDYAGLSWGIQQVAYLYNGCSLNQNGFVTMYRWHLPDPIFWQKECRVTIQQIGWNNGLFERQDDWSCATFWYEPIPSAPLPPLPDAAARTAHLWTDKPRTTN